MKKASEFRPDSTENVAALEELLGLRRFTRRLSALPQLDINPNDDWLIERHTVLRTKTQSDPDHPTRYRPCP